METKPNLVTDTTQTKLVQLAICVILSFIFTLAISYIFVNQTLYTTLIAGQPTVADLSPRTHSELDSILDLASTDYPTSFVEITIHEGGKIDRWNKFLFHEIRCHLTIEFQSGNLQKQTGECYLSDPKTEVGRATIDARVYRLVQSKSSRFPN